MGIQQGKGEAAFELPLGRKGQTISSGLVFRGVKTGGEGYSVVASSSPSSSGTGAEKGSTTTPGLPLIAWQGEPKPLAKRTGGLYEGRKVQFKGHAWQRDAPLKKEMIEAKMKEMQAKIAKFKNVSPGSVSLMGHPTN